MTYIHHSSSLPLRPSWNCIFQCSRVSINVNSCCNPTTHGWVGFLLEAAIFWMFRLCVELLHKSNHIGISTRGSCTWPSPNLLRTLWGHRFIMMLRGLHMIFLTYKANKQKKEKQRMSHTFLSPSIYRTRPFFQKTTAKHHHTYLMWLNSMKCNTEANNSERSTRPSLFASWKENMSFATEMTLPPSCKEG